MPVPGQSGIVEWVVPSLKVGARGHVTGREKQEDFLEGSMDGFTPSRRSMASHDNLLWQVHLLQKGLVPWISRDLLESRVALNNR
jgi:hypothetical protein